MKHRIAFVHTSPAAIPPLMQYYSREAPEFEITNLLDDGLLRLLAAGELGTAEKRFEQMLAAGREIYRAEAAMITCSAVPGPMLEVLREQSPIPLIKIDGPMARRVVAMGARIGLLVTNPPAAEPTRKLLLGAAEDEEKKVELIVELEPAAYEAILAGNDARHDELLGAAAQRLAAQGVDCIALAQVSMVRMQARIAAAAGVPVLSSLETSLAELRKVLG